MKRKNSPGPIGSTHTALTADPQSGSASQLRRRMLITLLEVLFYYYPSLLTTTLSLFACFHIDPSGSANSQYHNAQVCASLYILYMDLLDVFCFQTCWLTTALQSCCVALSIDLCALYIVGGCCKTSHTSGCWF